MPRFLVNPHRQSSLDPAPEQVEAFNAGDIRDFHRSLPGYHDTPLIRLSALAGELGLGEVFIKDESHRFDLNAFKALGAPYAVYRWLRSQWEDQFSAPFEFQYLYDGTAVNRVGARTVTTATDGNHGRSVAWAARLFGLQAVIYMPRGTVPARIEHIEKEGAEVIVVDGDYDETVRRVDEEAVQQDRQIIADTGYGGYTQIPSWVQAAYRTMFEEITEEIGQGSDPGVDVVFIQSGVGALAAAASWYYRKIISPLHQPKLVNIEPVDADCLFVSAATDDGEIRTTTGRQQSMMAGLNCGTPSTVAWPAIRQGFDLFLAIEDGYSAQAIRQFYFPKSGDRRIVSGESGAAGLAGLLALKQETALRDAVEYLGLDPETRVLLLNTEGATDPANFEKIITESA